MATSNNLLLYGPPGTGKTYNTVNYAVSIVENRPFEDIVAEGYPLALEKYDRYTKMGRIAFMTFHQSLSYDDFIEGIRPEITDTGDLVYVASPGVFYRFCESADHPELIDDGISEAFRDLSDNAKMFAVCDDSIPEGAENGDILVHVSEKVIDRIGIVKDGVVWQELSERPKADNGWTYPHRIYKPAKRFVFSHILGKKGGDIGNCVFIIDEINRGNVSRIFGELITLLESSRRKGNPECLEVYLAQMKKMFSVPDNVFVLGTMNTADKSLTALDAALRRRFEFIEMMPNPDVLQGRVVSGVEIGKLLETINKRVEILYDREHMLGHAYFISVRTMDDLAQCFINKVIPLLQEYFFDDYEKICWVLGRANDPRKCDFIKMRPRSSFQTKFNLPDIFDIVTDYRVFVNPESYIALYKGAGV